MEEKDDEIDENEGIEGNENTNPQKNDENQTRNLQRLWKQCKHVLLFAIGQYNLKLQKVFDPIQTSLLASECLSKEPSLMFCMEYLEKGADPNAIIGDGLTRPLHAVARKSNSLLVQCLVEAGADINAQNGRNQTPLIVASDSAITDSSYLAVIRYLARRRDSKINLRDVGGNTALLNGIYRNNVWITRELLLAGAQLTVGFGSPGDLSLFIFAESLSTDVQNLPESVLQPWNNSCLSHMFSFRGRYDYFIVVLIQLCYNSDISMVYRMINYRRLELEKEGIQLKQFHPIGTKSPEQLEQEELQRRQEELDKLKQRTAHREERQEKKKLTRRQQREAQERERWEGVLKGIEEKVNQEYGFHSYLPNEPKQTWLPIRPEEEEEANTATKSNSHSNDIRRGSLDEEKKSSPGKRWQVVEIKRNGVYSQNPYPGGKDVTSRHVK